MRGRAGIHGWRIVALLLALLALAAAPAAAAERPADGRVYVKMPDGVEIAVYLTFPQAWDGSSPLPTVMMYDGYAGAGQPVRAMGTVDPERYAQAMVGVRGAGCSGGEFHLFGRQHAIDGAHVVEWLARQPWSSGRIGLYGHSYSGFMALFVAAERPPHLEAVSASGIEADLYRGVAFPGGIPNRTFPAAFQLALRPLADVIGTQKGTQENGDTDCLQHVASRGPESPNSTIVPSMTRDEDGDFFHSHSLRSVMDRIAVPTQLHGGSIDEEVQGAPRGASLIFEAMEGRTRQLLLANGDHGDWQYQPEIIEQRLAWFDRFVAGERNGIEHEPAVQVLLDNHKTDGVIRSTGTVASNRYPLAQTRWRRLFAGPDGTLSPERPAPAGADTIVMGPGRHLLNPTGGESGEGNFTGYGLLHADGPDAARYVTPPAERTEVIAGPVMATLHARVHALDADFWVALSKEDADGNRTFLQRGWLRGSHRATDASRAGRAGRVVYRPWHPHTNPRPFRIGRHVRLQVEVLPIGFVLREGERLAMTVTAMPVQESYGVHQPSGAGIVELLREPRHATSILLPTMRPPESLGPAPACGTLPAMFCDKPAG